MADITRKQVVLGVTGGIAAYKAAELTRELQRKGIDVQVVLTRAAASLVAPATFQALSGKPVFSDLWDPRIADSMGHIELSREADLLVVAPATADILAKMAAGLADDLASTVLLATDKAVLMAPAMNVRMWLHAATQYNVATLRSRGVLFSIHDEDVPVFRLLRLRARRAPGLIEDAKEVLLKLFDADAEYSADTLEEIYDELEQASKKVLSGNVSDELAGYIARVRAGVGEVPLAIGFGISRAEHVAQVGALAEAAIVGAALINRIDAASPERRVQEVESFIRGLRTEG